MAAAVYILCAITSLACAVMLYRGYNENKFKLLFWCSLGFVGFFLNNVLLFVDLIIFDASTDLSVIRTLPALAGMMVMIYGLITDTV